MGVDTMGLAVLFLMAGSPAAISSFAMTKAMGRDADTAGDIVALSTAISFLTLTLGLTLLLPLL
jgi:predicted permease